MSEEQKISSRWHTLDTQRKTHLDRARHCARLTIPYLLPEEGDDHNDKLYTPYQAFGATAVNHLSSKLWLSLLPANNAFFKLSLSLKVQNELKQAADSENVKTRIQNSLAAIESAILQYIENTGIRSPAFSAVRQLIVTGNSMVYIPPSGRNHHPWSHRGYGLKVFRLDQYVVVRDTLGNLVESVILEKIAISALPEDIKEMVRNKVNSDKKEPDSTVNLYTRIVRSDDNENEFEVTQEVEGQQIEGSSETYKASELPWLILRWSQDGDYGRGPVEEYLGGFQSLEALNQAIVEGSLGAAKVLFLVNPNGLTSASDLASARNMDFREGRADDITTLQLEKYNDFRIADQTRMNIQQQLSQAFLMHSSVQRDAERVTAQEIQFMAQELEDTLGGVYSILSQEFQLPLVTLILNRLQEDGEIPEMPDEALNPVITTGLEALGRNHKQAKLRNFVAEIGQMFGPEMASLYINPAEYIQRSAINHGIETEGLIRSEEEVQQMLKKQRQEEAANQAVPTVAGKLTEGVIDNGSEGQ